MRKVFAVALLIFACNAAAAVETHPYRREYKQKTFGKKAIAPVLTGAAIKEARNSPHQWGRGPAGFGKRVGSSFGTHLVKNSIEYPIAAIRHEALHYYRSDKKGFGPRLKHALVSTVVTRKTTTGKKTVASGRLSGAFGSGLVATAWQPAGFSAAGGIASGGITLGTAAGVNVAREFWPRKAHRPRPDRAG
ncbi:MAG: hypothetical protein M3N54_09780 [Acidobacteriota bacterium]|nr:hypothetical protein [Acidobacteriota bacterium]